MMGTRQIPKYEHRCDRCWFQIENTSSTPPPDWQALEYVGSANGLGGGPLEELFCPECMKVIHPVKVFELQVPLTDEELTWILRKINGEAVPERIDALGRKLNNALNALKKKEENGPG